MTAERLDRGSRRGAERVCANASDELAVHQTAVPMIAQAVGRANRARAPQARTAARNGRNARRPPRARSRAPCGPAPRAARRRPATTAVRAARRRDDRRVASRAAGGTANARLAAANPLPSSTPVSRTSLCSAGRPARSRPLHTCASRRRRSRAPCGRRWRGRAAGIQREAHRGDAARALVHARAAGQRPVGLAADGGVGDLAGAGKRLLCSNRDGCRQQTREHRPAGGGQSGVRHRFR
jgi:hypothetical protein